MHAGLLKDAPSPPPPLLAGAPGPWLQRLPVHITLGLGGVTGPGVGVGAGWGLDGGVFSGGVCVGGVGG